jgi:branched-chain amino acid transport system ATP-binding protein
MAMASTGDRDGTGRDSASALIVEDLHLRFGGVVALAGVSMSIPQGKIFAIVGPNGAGKTSLLNAASGLYRPNRGRILFAGRDLTHLQPHQLGELGIARTFQNIARFRGLTVLDSLLLGRHVHMHTNALTAGLFFGPARREEIRHRDVVEDIIDFLEIEQIRRRPIGMLPYGLQKRVELGRALAMEPKLLLLDEPMAGMNVEEKEDMARFILDINEERGVTVVLIEHDMGVIMDISERVAVLDFGKKIAEGPPAEIKVNPEVIRAYLGEEDEALHRMELEAEAAAREAQDEAGAAEVRG